LEKPETKSVSFSIESSNEKVDNALFELHTTIARWLRLSPEFLTTVKPVQLIQAGSVPISGQSDTSGLIAWDLFEYKSVRCFTLQIDAKIFGGDGAESTVIRAMTNQDRVQIQVKH